MNCTFLKALENMIFKNMLLPRARVTSRGTQEVNIIMSRSKNVGPMHTTGLISSH